MNSLAEIIQWPACPGVPSLADNEIHVWATTLQVDAGVLKDFSDTLSSDEQARANRFKFEKHRNRFIAGRGALRAILASYLHTDPAQLSFTYSSNGKPAFTEELAANTGIHFNLAHSDELALVAVTRLGNVGVDVESVRVIENVNELVARFFSERENEKFQKVPEEQKPAAFFNLWSRKEALLKATGEGITRSLSLVEVSFLPGEVAKLLAIAGDEVKAAEWSLRELFPATGFTGAIAIQAKELELRCWKWEANSSMHR